MKLLMKTVSKNICENSTDCKKGSIFKKGGMKCCHKMHINDWSSQENRKSMHGWHIEIPQFFLLQVENWERELCKVTLQKNIYK